MSPGSSDLGGLPLSPSEVAETYTEIKSYLNVEKSSNFAGKRPTHKCWPEHVNRW